jgi:hypothetical protein
MIVYPPSGHALAKSRPRPRSDQHLDHLDSFAGYVRFLSQCHAGVLAAFRMQLIPPSELMRRLNMLVMRCRGTSHTLLERWHQRLSQAFSPLADHDFDRPPPISYPIATQQRLYAGLSLVRRKETCKCVHLRRSATQCL